MTTTTDASHLQDMTAEGMGSPHQQCLHINHLDLLAIKLALKAFFQDIQHKVVLIKTDNMTAMYYLQKQGSTHSPQLSALAQSIWNWVIHQRIHLLAEYLPGVDNDFADLLSRMQQQVHEWELHPQVLHHYFQLGGLQT
mgnify:CR=1 FL=1